MHDLKWLLIKLWIDVLIIGAILLAIASMFVDKAHASTEWTASTFALQKSVVKVGVSIPMARDIINECKATAKDPLKCVKTTVAIYGNESGFGSHCKNNSCWWVVSRKYNTRKEAMKDFVRRYNLFWYKHNGAFFFYGSKGKLWASMFCTSEVSSNTKVGCPNWAKTFTYFYSLISSASPLSWAGSIVKNP